MTPARIQSAIRRALHALAISTTKPSPKPGGGPSSVEPPMPIPAGVLDGKHFLHESLHGWARAFSEDWGIVIDCDNDDVSILGWMHTKATDIAEHDAALDFVGELTEAVRMIESPYLPRAGRKYLGHHGGGDVYVKPGQTMVELEDGTVERVESIRAWNADQMLMLEGTASEVVTIIREYFGHTITPQDVAVTHRNDRRKTSGTKLESVRKDGNANIYRVWDVLNRLCRKEKLETA